MKPRKKIFLWTAIWFSLAAAVVTGIFYTQVVLPRTNFQTTCENSKSTPDELRAAAHRVLAWNVNHDAFLTLELAGNQSSIPVLIRSLRRLPKGQLESGNIECTWGHCHDALVSITGKDFQYDADQWENWYDKRRSEQAVPSDGHKPSSHGSSADPTAPADAH
jgi:hypothetical protein